MTPQIAPYGSWKSPITAEMTIAGKNVADPIGFGQIALDGQDVYWIESRPEEQGRSVVMQRKADGTVVERTPAPFNVRTRVHEYGGGA
ncbi:MAG: S9 family peptidase, partial [Chloroflexi bacterium]